MRKLVFLTLLCACCFSMAQAESNDGFIKGVVHDNRQKGLADVAIILDQKRICAMTDTKGAYQLQLQPGTYRLTFSQMQYKTVDTTVVVSAGQTLDCSITMQEAVFDLDQVVVTGSSRSRELRKLAASISVIRSSDPEYKNIKSVDEALSRIPGVLVDRSRGLSTTGSHTTVTLRGTGAANRTLIMKDGIPINNANTGGVAIWSSMASNSISRVEIVRGATSSLYGSNAMGGVINLKTEDPTQDFTIGASAQYGSFNTGIYNFKVGQKLDNGFGYMVFTEYKHTDGYKYMEGEAWKEYYGTPSAKLLNTVAKLSYDFKNDSRLEFIGDFHLDKSQTGTSTRYFGTDRMGNFQLSYSSAPNKRFTYDLTAYSNRSWDKDDPKKYNSETGAFDKNYYKSSIPYGSTGFIGKVNTQWGINTLTLGADVRYNDMNSRYYYYDKGDRNFSGKQMFYSVFLNDELSLGKYFDVSLSLRYDYWKNMSGSFFDNTSGDEVAINYPSRHSDAISPRAGIVFHPSDKVRLRTSISTGFKAPSIYYLYRSAPHGSAKFDLGNPDLKPERMTYSYEVGGDYYISDKFEFSATYYISEFKDFLDKITVPENEIPDYFNPGPGVEVNKSVNIGRVRLQGVEASIRYNILPVLTFNAGYTYAKSKILKYEIEPEYVGKELEDSPNHLFNAGLLYDNPRLFSVGVWFKYVGQQYRDMSNAADKRLAAYELVDLTLSKSILKDRLTFNFTVNNLFNKKYYSYYSSETSYYFGQGISFMGGIALKW